MNVTNVSSGKLSVNLLPGEFLVQQRQSLKVGLLRNISIGISIIIIFIASATLALRLSQSFVLENANKNLSTAEVHVSGLRDVETKALSLKQRLMSVQGLIGLDTKRKAIFNLMILLSPADINFIEASIDRNNNMVVTMNSSSLSSIEILFNKLGDKEENHDLVDRVDLDGISLGKDGQYRFTLKIISKK